MTFPTALQTQYWSFHRCIRLWKTSWPRFQLPPPPVLLLRAPNLGPSDRFRSTVATLLMVWATKLRTTEWLGLKGTSTIIQFHPVLWAASALHDDFPQVLEFKLIGGCSMRRQTTIGTVSGACSKQG